MKEINSDAKTIWQLLARQKFTLDYYQREYVWQTKQVTDLIEDLTKEFLSNFQEGHEPTHVKGYGHYFLGSIVICNTNRKQYIIDGQQRLTTLTLLLIRLYHLLNDEDLKNRITNLIFSTNFGSKSFNLDSEDREPIMSAIYLGETLEDIETDDLRGSVHNISVRYTDIETNFDLKEEQLLCFVDWLLEKVYLVEITAYTDDDAYTIFETMNDRGLSLTPSEMLRGYLLSNISDKEQRIRAGDIWAERIKELKQIGKEEESEAIKAWLRSQYAQRFRDFEIIGSEFHRWVREKEESLGLSSNDDYANFIESKFEFYSSWYNRLCLASKELQSGFEYVYYNAQHNFTLQYPVLLAPLSINDSDEDNLKKVQITAIYLDILIHRYIWNSSSIAQRSMVTPMYSLMADIRGMNLSVLSDFLYQKLQESIIDFDKNNQFGLYGSNKSKIHLVLARITDYLEVQSGNSSNYQDYIKKTGNGYQIEHVWTNQYDQYKDEFSQKSDFESYRDRIGGLLLLPKRTNVRYDELPFTKKREHYLKENLLAQSFHEDAYDHNSELKQFIMKSGLGFKSHSEFNKDDLNIRQELYQQLAGKIWNPERLKIPYGHEPPQITIRGGKDKLIDTGQNVKKYIWLRDKIAEKVPLQIKNRIEISYKNTIMDYYQKVADLYNQIEGTEWKESLTLEFNEDFCTFNLEKQPVFGVILKDEPRFSICISQEEAEQLKSHCVFERYSIPLKSAIYPAKTRIDSLLTILEYAYIKHC